MRTILIVLAVMIIVVSLASGSGYVEIENRINGSVVTPNINIFSTRNITARASIFAFSLTSENYSEAYAGVSYNLRPWLNIGAGLGLETADSPWRVASSLWAGKGNTSLLVIYENGGSGYWYKAVVSHSVNQWFTIGVYMRRFIGVGPLLKVSIPNTLIPLSISLVPSYDFELEARNLLIIVQMGL